MFPPRIVYSVLDRMWAGWGAERLILLGQRPEDVLDPGDGYVATVTATVTFTCILVQGGGPPWISYRALPGPGFSVSDYSRTRLALFPNSFT